MEEIVDVIQKCVGDGLKCEGRQRSGEYYVPLVSRHPISSCEYSGLIARPVFQLHGSL